MNRNTDPATSPTRVTAFWRVILLFVLAGAVAGYGFKVATHPVYQATTTLLVGDVTQASGFSKSDVDASRALAATYGALIREQPVLGPVVQTLRLPITWQKLKDRVHVGVGINGSLLVTVVASGATPEEATTIAAAVADQVRAISPASITQPSTPASTFALARMEELQKSITAAQARLDAAGAQLTTAPLALRPSLRSRISSAQSLIIRLQANYVSLASLVSAGGSPNVIQVIQPAEANEAPVRPNARADVLIGAAAGLILGLIVATFLAGRRNLRRPVSTATRTAHVAASPVAEEKALRASKPKGVYSDPNFQRFWENYPLKKGKASAFRRWQQAVAAGVAPQQIIDAALRYRNDPSRDPASTKWPEGWLHDGRWERTRDSDGSGELDRVDQRRVGVSVGERDPWLREMIDPNNLPEKS